MKFDALGDRMKSNYENRTRNLLPRRSYTIIRVDGKAFHTYTKGLKRPFDDGLIEDMDLTAAYLCKNIMGAKFAFVQSDEISILLTDFDDIGTQAWFDNNIQKMCSVSASMATGEFNRLRGDRFEKERGQYFLKKPPLAFFDSRVFQIPQKIEVENYFIWRQQDTVRNSISAVAQSLYSSKELHGKNSDQQQEMIFQKGTNWNDFEPKYKRGRMIYKTPQRKKLFNLNEAEQIERVKKSNENEWYVDHQKNEFGIFVKQWQSIEVPTFTQERNFLSEKIPNNI